MGYDGAMIASLQGVVQDISSRSLTLSVGGVGYEVFCPDVVLGGAQQGKEVKLYTHHHVRENAEELYGFTKKEERAMFEVLLGVSGIGPKAALTIMNAAPTTTLQQAIVEQDASVLTKVSGIGSKKAQKIIIELKDKFADVLIAVPGSVSIEAEVVEALESIGYSRAQAQKILRELPSDMETAEEKIREALKLLGKG